MKGKKTGGRVKGVPNKRTTQIRQEISSHGITPLDFLLRELRDESLPYDARHAAAVAAAPYLHSKMPTAIVTPPPPSGPVSEDDERVLDLYLASLHDEADES
jgi:hypothetical protein